MRRSLLTMSAATVVVPLLSLSPAGFTAQEKKLYDPAAVDRARKTVRMLDDIYKTGIVLVTEKYVHSEKDYPAGRLAVKWFKEISKKGTHEIRIIDASGQPYNKENVARDDFDKEGIRQIKRGRDFYDQVVRKDGKSYLRAMTPVPVVSEKCIMCHHHYKSVKKGEAIGALTYMVPIE